MLPHSQKPTSRPEHGLTSYDADWSQGSTRRAQVKAGTRSTTLPELSWQLSTNDHHHILQVALRTNQEHGHATLLLATAEVTRGSKVTHSKHTTWETTTRYSLPLLVSVLTLPGPLLAYIRTSINSINSSIRVVIPVPTNPSTYSVRREERDVSCHF